MYSTRLMTLYVRMSHSYRRAQRRQPSQGSPQVIPVACLTTSPHSHVGEHNVAMRQQPTYSEEARWANVHQHHVGVVVRIVEVYRKLHCSKSCMQI